MGEQKVAGGQREGAGCVEKGEREVEQGLGWLGMGVEQRAREREMEMEWPAPCACT